VSATATIGRQGFQTQPDRILPGRAAGDGRANRQAVQCLGCQLFLARTDNRLNNNIAEGFGRMPQHRLAGEGFILFRQSQPGAFAFSGGNDQHGDARHELSKPLKDLAALRPRAIPSNICRDALR